MATAGDRHEKLTGNIWNYANRGDLTGVKAAIHRGVNINIQNTAGWTACHAAAAGGRTKTLRFLVKAGADLEIQDSGGQLPSHHAAKNGHVHALKLLEASGSDLTNVRLSQGRGNGVREVLIEALKKAGKDEQYEEEAVGYSRKQSKSTAFWGPRRTPISGKIKKKILKERRQKKQQKISTKLADNSDEHKEMGPEDGENSHTEELKHSYLETVQMVKRERKNRRRKQNTNVSNVTENEEEEAMTVRDESTGKGSQETFIHSNNGSDDASDTDVETQSPVSSAFQLLHLDDSSSSDDEDDD